MTDGTMTTKGLRDKLLELTGKRAYFVTIQTKTDARAKVKSRVTLEPIQQVYGTTTIYKVAKRRVLINASYEKMVLKRRAGEGIVDDSWKAGELKWGHPVGQSKCLYQKDDQFYLRVYQLKTGDLGTAYYRDDGTEITDEKLLARLPNEFLNLQHDGRQGLSAEHKVIVNTYKLESIYAINHDRFNWLVVNI